MDRQVMNCVEFTAFRCRPDDHLTTMCRVDHSIKFFFLHTSLHLSPLDSVYYCRRQGDPSETRSQVVCSGREASDRDGSVKT